MDWVDLSRRWVPRPIRSGVQRFISLGELKRGWRARLDPLSTVTGSDINTAGSPVRVGILRNSAQYHTCYVRACQEMGLPFRVLDLAATDWLSRVKESECGLFFAWPEATQSQRAKLYKDRCDVIEQELGCSVVPHSRERWLYEDKIRVRDWLMTHGVPHPKTWVFADRYEAKAFVATCELPIVFKTAFGAASAGVRILRNRRSLQGVVRQAFGKGHVASGHDHRDREFDRLLLQEYLPDLREWRMVRIGDSYFGHPKGRAGDFHSGSGLVSWDPPDSRLLELLRKVTELGGFRSMAVDVFETVNGSLLVNEVQTVFGASTSIDQMRMDGRPGRMVRSDMGEWAFEAGDYARNACANARIQDALLRLSTMNNQGMLDGTSRRRNSPVLKSEVS